MLHIPVLTAEVLEILQPGKGGLFIDATTGTAGHSLAMLTAARAAIKLFCLDRDRYSLEEARNRLKDFSGQITFQEGDFRDLKLLAASTDFNTPDGIIYDLGLSSYLLNEAERGFSFQREGPLDMRFNRTLGEPVSQLLNDLSSEELADVLYQYGEIRESRRLAARIKEAINCNAVNTTTQLADISRRVIRRHGKSDPAARVFQALRIAVNRELESLEISLPQAVEILKPGGRLAIISYHSLEDRIVKNFLKQNEQLRVITKKPVRPQREEIIGNPASRSAKLRGAVKI
ncbi:MAG: 16S rRNA (cytosine(1402)-N(4))-methyltransferase RsmH [Candidatus Omnitrophica bacterium]|nr:16S rRNA (cytosine(1402)-N(4))-methyltransferase RsmH [Candidatus Omnitrophota bacterium]